MLRFHFPLIKPDVQISRIRLSDKDSCFRPRNVAVAQAEQDKSQLTMQMLIGITRDRLSRLHLVLPTQPPTEPFAGMLGYDPIGFTHGPLAKVVRPSHHDAVELAYLFLGIPPAPLSIGHFADPAANRLNLSLRWSFAHI